MRWREIWNELRVMGKPAPTQPRIEPSEVLDEAQDGVVYHLIRKRYPPWLYMIVVLGYTVGLFFLIKWFHLGHL